MALNSGIEWTDHTWNPWQGCHKVSDGCVNCYMEREKRRYGQDPSVVVRSKDVTFNSPLKWKDPARVFTCSWSDFFIEEADAWRSEAWDIMRLTPHLTYLILTKRIERAAERLPADWPWEHVWLGATIEDQSVAAHRLDHLHRVPGHHFISCEPLLGPLNLRRLEWPTEIRHYGRTEWVIAGPETGPIARPMEEDWARDLMLHCKSAGVPFFLKKGTIDGVQYREIPEGMAR